MPPGSHAAGNSQHLELFTTQTAPSPDRESISVKNAKAAKAAQAANLHQNPHIKIMKGRSQLGTSKTALHKTLHFAMPSSF